MHHREGADERDGHGDERDDGGPPGLEEEDDDEDDEDDGLEEGVDDGVDGLPHEDGGIVGDGVVDALGELRLQFGHFVAHRLGHGEGVRSGELEDTHADGLLVVDEAAQGVLGAAHLGAGDVAEAELLAVGPGLHDDLLEFLLGDEAALRVHGELEGRFLRRLLPDRAGGDLDILLADGVDDVAGGETARGGFVRVDPDAHGVFAPAEDLHLPDPGEAGELVLHVQGRVVPQVDLVIAIIRGEKVDDEGHVGRGLHRRHAEAAHLLGQLRQDLGDAVLHLDLGEVEVGPDLEGHRQGHDAVRGALRGHVKHVLDPVDGLLQRRGHGLGDGLRVRARIGRGDDHGRGRDLGILRDGELEERDRPEDEDQERERPRKDRTGDEEAREIHVDFTPSRRTPGRRTPQRVSPAFPAGGAAPCR